MPQPTAPRTTGGPARRKDSATGNDMRQWLIYATAVAVPVIALLADHAMWVFGIAQHLPAGRWLAVAVAFLYAGQNLIALYLLVIGFALDSPGAALQQPPRWPAWWFLKQAAMVIALLCVINAPLTVCVAIAGLVT